MSPALLRIPDLHEDSQIIRIHVATETASARAAEPVIRGKRQDVFHSMLNEDREFLPVSRPATRGRETFHAQHIVTHSRRIELQHPKDSVRRCSGASPTRVLAYFSV